METNLDKNILFQFLTNPALGYRLGRHVVLWSTAIFLIYRGFQYIALTIPDRDAQQVYAVLSTIIFGGLTVNAYFLITWLTRNYILVRFRFNLFIGCLLLVHILTSALVRWHFLLFIHYLTLANLPRMYSVYAGHVIQMPVWQVPFDSIIVGLFSFSLFYNYLLYAVGLKVFKDLFTMKTQQDKLEQENLQLEFNFLKAQINPHFLFNTLNNIYSFSIQSPEKVAGAILKLADLMRYALYETEAEQVLLAKELAFLDSYVQLQRIRHDENVELTYTVHGQPGTSSIPPLLLIVFVENAFKHGPQASAQGGSVHIRLTITQHILRFQVENNLPPKATIITGGIGLNNVRKRLNHYYGGHYHLQIDEVANSFRVNLQIQLHEPTLPSYHRG
ncbi:sensor histidine kinase [Fibrella forsythiae]|uniref:Sensor histidine kinase n=1 Tax=Fibrella forsythiae TaxID=2817061 RepID=A0ABS3JTI8_9BACT|nr:sensor histidine kinase [Fibrella forsythiae]MBO0953331.1 sensor histidine kinase [Fibrella forsythiae]